MWRGGGASLGRPGGVRIRGPDPAGKAPRPTRRRGRGPGRVRETHLRRPSRAGSGRRPTFPAQAEPTLTAAASGPPHTPLRPAPRPRPLSPPPPLPAAGAAASPPPRSGDRRPCGRPDAAGDRRPPTDGQTRGDRQTQSPAAVAQTPPGTESAGGRETVTASCSDRQTSAVTPRQTQGQTDKRRDRQTNAGTDTHRRTPRTRRVAAPSEAGDPVNQHPGHDPAGWPAGPDQAPLSEDQTAPPRGPCDPQRTRRAPR